MRRTKPACSSASTSFSALGPAMPSRRASVAWCRSGSVATIDSAVSRAGDSSSPPSISKNRS